MHKISNLTGSARHGWEKMSPTALGMTRPNMDLPVSPPSKRPLAGNPVSPATASDHVVNLSFNVPFSNLAGPDVQDILHASPGALERWIHPEGTEEGTPTHKLPVHTSNVDSLRKLCREVSSEDGGKSTVEATVTSSEAKPIPEMQHRPLKGLVTNVCLSGDAETVHKLRGRILNETPIALVSGCRLHIAPPFELINEQRCATVDIDTNLVIDSDNDSVKASVLEHLNVIASFTGTDAFLLGPRPMDPETAGSNFNGSPDTGLDQRLRVAVYGDMESAEHAKTRVLIMIDQIVSFFCPSVSSRLTNSCKQLERKVDSMKVDLSLHTLICGRSRKNIKVIESVTNTAIYFPPPFPRVYGYTPPGAHRRSEDEVFITGANAESIVQAKKKLHELVSAKQSGYEAEADHGPRF